MEVYRKIIILIICLIFFYILYRLVLKRFEIYTNISSVESESFQTKTVSKIDTSNTTKLNIRTMNIDAINPVNGIGNKKRALELRQYCIKAAYHPAFDGNEMSLDMLGYTMNRGCRFLVFEIYWAAPTQLNTSITATNPNFINSACPVVALSNDPAVPASNCLALQDVIAFINEMAFTNACPNNGDPMFIQFCVKYDVNVVAASTVYDAIASIVEKMHNLYRGNVTSTTSIADLMGKVVIVMDKKNKNSYFTADSPDLAAVVNLSVPSNSMQGYTYSELNGASNKPMKILSGNSGYITNATEINQVLPHTSKQLNEGSNTPILHSMTSNYNALGMVSNHGVQITPMLFWSNENYLSQYENMFNYGKAGIIPMSAALRFAMHNSSSNVTNIAYP